MAGFCGTILLAFAAFIPLEAMCGCVEGAAGPAGVAEAAPPARVDRAPRGSEGAALPDTIADEEKPEARPVKSVSPKGAVLRSALYPGWGQLSNGKPYKACVVFGVEVYFAGVAVLAGRRAQDLLDRSRFAVSEVELADLERRYEEYIERRNAYLWWLGAAVLYSMLDAYVDAGLADVEEGLDKPAPIFLESSAGDDGSLRLGIGARF
jgi:hypothetical protein